MRHDTPNHAWQNGLAETLNPAAFPKPPSLAEAIALLQQGRFDAAEALLLALLQREPRSFDALHLAGVAAVQAGRLMEGVPRIQRAIAMNPKSSAAHNNLGTALIRLDKYQEALASFDRAVRANPDNAQAHHGRGAALGKLARLDEAIAAYGRAIALAPNYAEAYADRGCAFAEKKDWDAALADQEKALSLNPHSAECLANLALALCHFKRFDEALALSENVLQRHPASAAALQANMIALLETGRTAEALDRADALTHTHPLLADGHSWRAQALALLGQPEAALLAADEARKTAPGDHSKHDGYGNALINLNRVEEALASYGHALKIKPDDIDTHWDRALALLKLGRFEDGWPEYEYRIPRHKNQATRQYSTPPWLGREPLKGQRLFLYWEQGFGDTIQFSRYALLAAKAGAQVILSVQDPLRRLFKDFDPAIQVIGQNEEPASFDLHSLLLSAPLAFETRLETIPAWPDGYLKSPAQEIARWAQCLPAGRRRIGLVWGGNPKHGNDANRSVPLEKLFSLFQSGDSWVSLQKDLREGDAAKLRMANIFDYSSKIDDFADTAALVSALDLVITVDTSVAHLAGALGKPVWAMLPFAPDFRWFLDRDDSPWYPSMRLFRQQRPGDWAGVIARIKEAL